MLAILVPQALIILLVKLHRREAKNILPLTRGKKRRPLWGSHATAGLGQVLPLVTLWTPRPPPMGKVRLPQSEYQCPPNSHVEILTPKMMVFGSGAFER